MIRSKAPALLAGATLALLLSACGGGGGGGSGSSPAGSSTEFALGNGYKALIVNGYSVDFDVTGTCSGTATQVNQPADSGASFEGVAGFKTVSTQTLTFSNCTPASSTGTADEFFNATYASLGTTIDGEHYGVNQSPASLPATVHVGDSGPIGVEMLYADSSKTTVTGRVIRTYAITADTATTAIGILTSAHYDAADHLVFTEQDAYRIAADGTLAVLSVDIRDADANGLHLMLTAR